MAVSYAGGVALSLVFTQEAKDAMTSIAATKQTKVCTIVLKVKKV